MSCPQVQERLADHTLGEAPAGQRAVAEPPRRTFVLRHPWLMAAALGAVVVAGAAVMHLRPAADEELPEPAQPKVALEWHSSSGNVRFQQPQDQKQGSPHEADQRDELKSLGYAVNGDGVDEGVVGGIPGGVAGGVPGGVVGGLVGGLSGGPVLIGGTLPARPRAMFFQHQGTNPFGLTEQDALSTFGLDVDTASYTLTRSYLQRGMLPPASAVRVEEFVNALPQDDAPDERKTFAIRVEGAPNPFHAGHHVLRIGLKAREVAPRDRRPAVLTFVVDVSGSMAMENRLGLVKRSLRLLVDRLDDNDRIGLVVYGSNGRVILHPTPASHRAAILGAIEGLVPEGSTNLEEGLSLGYDMATQSFDRAATNRVVLCTDGVANNGVTDPEALLRQIRSFAQKGIAMTALGFGMGSYNDALLQKLADQGDGQYAYIDDFREAQAFFLRTLTKVLELVARDAKAQVEFDPGRVESYRLLGYEKRDIADQDFRDDGVDGGEVNSGHTVTVLYELKLREAAGPLGTVRVRYAEPDSAATTEESEPIEEASLRDAFDEASPRFRLTLLAARFAEHLRKSRWVQAERLETVLARAEELPSNLRRTPEAAELVDLLSRAVALSKEARP